MLLPGYASFAVGPRKCHQAESLALSIETFSPAEMIEGWGEIVVLNGFSYVFDVLCLSRPTNNVTGQPKKLKRQNFIRMIFFISITRDVFNMAKNHCCPSFITRSFDLIVLFLLN